MRIEKDTFLEALYNYLIYLVTIYSISAKRTGCFVGIATCHDLSLKLVNTGWRKCFFLFLNDKDAAALRS